MKFKEGDVLYKIPIRYWEDKTPTKCIVVKDVLRDYHLIGSIQNSFLVYSEEYGHNVYVDREYLFFDYDKCIKAIELYSKLYELYKSDEFEEWYRDFSKEVVGNV
jgi:hypothetical protein